MKRTRLSWLIGATVATFLGCAVGSNGASDTDGPVATIDGGADVTPTPGNDADANTPPADAAKDAAEDPCVSPNTCESAADLGTISGDTGAETKTAEGVGSKWFQVRVTEDDDSPTGSALYMHTRLQVPAGSVYEVNIYIAGTESAKECTTPTGQGESLTSTLRCKGLTWGETDKDPAGNAVDDRTVLVEVRHVSGDCTPSDTWQLTLTGNTAKSCAP
jgi:hypothetical protein